MTATVCDSGRIVGGEWVDHEQQSGSHTAVDERDANAGLHFQVVVGSNYDRFDCCVGAAAGLPGANVLGNFSVEQRADSGVVGTAVLGAVGDEAAGEVIEGYAGA